MPRNIEIKVRIKDPRAMMEQVAAMADGCPIELNLDDSYFSIGAGSGALKLRVLSPAEGHLIHYARRNTSMPGIYMSQWLLYETSEPSALRGLLERALGSCDRITKRRLLYHSGNVWIHIDDEQDAGWFLELEALLSPEETEEVGVSRVLAAMNRLGISSAETIAQSYQFIRQQDSLPEAKSEAAREQRVVMAAFLSQDGKVLMAKRAAHKRVAPNKWHLPGGHVEFGEDPAQALKRELWEEFGVESVIGPPEHSFSYVWDGKHTVGIVHEAWLADPTQPLRWSDADFQACAWVGEEELADYLTTVDHNYHAAKAGFSRLYNSSLSGSNGRSQAVSDGHHTFDELYAHLNHLFVALMRSHPKLSWRARQHEDGTMDDSWFIAGMHLPSGDISYHLPSTMWETLDGCGIVTTTCAPKWDGHGAAEVVDRLAAWTGG